ncbi:MAG: hypothetical protein HUK01_10790 [Bacteroidaceae bacterium]|nr:hypothetical protein [Bacteroidaceae bacterium]
MFLIDDLLIIGACAAFGYSVGTVVQFVLDVLIDEDTLGNEVQNRYPEALKLLIQQKKRNAVNVGIFDECDNEIASDVEISSSEGVSDNLYVGQEIYLY